mmetsp:Transcript_42047/g.57366  ORF Transcript_42047/g.57366 Transcript_42047/m.57366 type:complete len:220 (-) Transcript_42047:1075-1734(-)
MISPRFVMAGHQLHSDTSLGFPSGEISRSTLVPSHPATTGTPSCPLTDSKEASGGEKAPSTKVGSGSLPLRLKDIRGLNRGIKSGTIWYTALAPMQSTRRTKLAMLRKPPLNWRFRCKRSRAATTIPFRFACRRRRAFASSVLGHALSPASDVVSPASAAVRDDDRPPRRLRRVCNLVRRALAADPAAMCRNGRASGLVRRATRSTESRSFSTPRKADP